MADIALIKQLREMTQAGFVDVKKALEENNNDLEAAAKWLREKGIAKAAKKAGAIASEGATLVAANENKAVILEVNSQTDFAAQNENFIRLTNEIKEALLNSNAETLEQALELKLASGSTIGGACDAITGRIGEKISLRRFTIYTKNNNQAFGLYQHANKRYSSLVLFDKPTDDTFKKNIAMHIVAMNPKFVNAFQVDQKWLQNEKDIIAEQTIASGKPKEFAGKIVEGRINKLLSEICLESQEFDLEPGKKVGQALKDHGIQVLKFVRYEVGEGIEKKQVNFADEVAAQCGCSCGK